MTVAEQRVRVATGALRGSVESQVVVFRGIPFAEPRRRLGAPEPVRAWEGTRDALTFGPPPPQSGILGVDTGAGSEGGG